MCPTSRESPVIQEFTKYEQTNISILFIYDMTIFRRSDLRLIFWVTRFRYSVILAGVLNEIKVSLNRFSWLELRLALFISLLLGLSTAFADGPPEGEDPAKWCEANEDACSEWCASHPEEEICEEPDCE